MSEMHLIFILAHRFVGDDIHAKNPFPKPALSPGADEMLTFGIWAFLKYALTYVSGRYTNTPLASCDTLFQEGV
jgi:hypothetical protein